jgi:hypothetical protein
VILAYVAFGLRTHVHEQLHDYFRPEERNDFGPTPRFFPGNYPAPASVGDVPLKRGLHLEVLALNDRSSTDANGRYMRYGCVLMPALRPIQSRLSSVLLLQVSISFPTPHSDLDIVRISQSPLLVISTLPISRLEQVDAWLTVLLLEINKGINPLSLSIALGLCPTSINKCFEPIMVGYILAVHHFH